MGCVTFLNTAPRCTAKSKRSGAGCQAPAVRGWNVCRMHGARGGAPSGAANGRWRHGNRTKANEAMRRALSALMTQARETAKALGNP